ncbi:unnamed protein product, partial [Urochloa humidicola]
TGEAEAEATAAVAAASCQSPTPYHPDVRVHAELPSPARTSGFQAACGSIGLRSARARSSSDARCRRFLSLSLSMSGRRRSPSPWTGQQRPPPPPRTEASGGLVAVGLDAAAGVGRSAKSELLLRRATRRPWYAALPPFTLVLNLVMAKSSRPGCIPSSCIGHGLRPRKRKLASLHHAEVDVH